MSTTEITNSDDIIDSRDVIARIAELEAAEYVVDDGEGVPEGGQLPILGSFATEEEASEFIATLPGYETGRYGLTWELDEYEQDELAALKELDETSSPDWQYGATLIRDSYFKTYAQDFAEDIGAVEDFSRWPCSAIDWDQAARELQMDYTSISFAGVDYWIR